jgi:hypothetical protein
MQKEIKIIALYRAVCHYYDTVSAAKAQANQRFAQQFRFQNLNRDYSTDFADVEPTSLREGGVGRRRAPRRGVAGQSPAEGVAEGVKSVASIRPERGGRLPPPE